MGTLDGMIPLMLAKQEEENTAPTLGLLVVSGGYAGAARAGVITDVEAFAKTVEWAIKARDGFKEVVLDDLRRVLIGDGWTTEGRNHGELALKFDAFLDTGFKPEFRDGGNQVQHAMAGIYIRALYGWLRSKLPYWMEDEDQDLALYRAAFDIGDLLQFNQPIENLPKLIRDRLGA